MKGRLFVLLAALLFSTGGAAVKAITATAWQVSAWRCAIAAVVLTALLPEARRHWSWRLLPPALAYAGTLLLFVMATKLTTSAKPSRIAVKVSSRSALVAVSTNF